MATLRRRRILLPVPRPTAFHTRIAYSRAVKDLGHSDSQITLYTAGTGILWSLKPLHSTEELTQALIRHGFSLRFADADFVAKTRVVHDGSGLPADLVLAGPGIEELFAARCVRQKLLDVSVPVACAEDIVVMKILAGREKDRNDIEAIIAARLPKLDLGLIRETLARLEQALDQSDLTPAFEALLARARAP